MVAHHVNNIKEKGWPYHSSSPYYRPPFMERRNEEKDERKSGWERKFLSKAESGKSVHCATRPFWQ